MKTVKRHSLLVRLTHWTVAISGILLIFSGFGQMPMYKRYFITAIPGLHWSGNFEITLAMHYLTAIVFTAAITYHLVYHIMMSELSIMPRKGDIKESVQGLKAMLGLAKEPTHEKFQAKQRVIYAVIGVDSLLLIITGLFKSYKNIGPIVLDPMFLQWMAMLHVVTAVIFTMLFVAHVAALMLKSHRPLIPSMITGRICKDYADNHHSAWKADL